MSVVLSGVDRPDPQSEALGDGIESPVAEGVTPQ